MSKATCAVDDCPGAVQARGWCGVHYSRWYNHGDPLAGGPPRMSQRGPRATRKPRKTCMIDECGKPVKAQGWCQAHYNRWRAHGDPLGGRTAKGAFSGGPCKVDDCGEPAKGGLGWCRRHYQKWYNTGDPLAPDKYTRRGAPLRERLEARIIKTDYCWFWTGKPNRSGYGVIGITDENGRKLYMAHRVAYEVFAGPIPEGLVLDHLCRNRACVRPDHLEPVEQLENVRRGAATERGTHCPSGHEFTEENTYWVRTCITCHRASRDRWKAKRRKARKAA